MGTETIRNNDSLVNALTPPKKTFKFSHELDSQFLESTYDQNIKFAHQIFELFINTIDDDLLNLEMHVKAFDFKKINQAAHKLKPTFLYVGLKSVNEILIQLEHASHAHSTKVDLLHKEVVNEYTAKIDAVKFEFQKMTFHLN